MRQTEGEKERTDIVQDFRKFGDVCQGFTVGADEGGDRDRSGQDQVRCALTKLL